MDRLDNISNVEVQLKGIPEADIQKLKSLKNVKNLIKNYKNIIQSQDELLNKVVVKAKDFKTHELQLLQNKYSKGFEE